MRGEECLFESFIQGGFECSTHLRRSGQRLDLIHSTGHDCLLEQDYQALQDFGIRTVRDAARWHCIEEVAGEYCFETLDALLDAAQATETQTVLDLLHFGWPGHTDVYSDHFAEDFGRFVKAVAVRLRARHKQRWFVAPINEISFLAWGGGSVGCINPYVTGRGDDLKRRLIRAAVKASEILLNELPGVRLVSPEPVIHIVGSNEILGSTEEAESYRLAQFQAWDMLAGRSCPELGGRAEYLDVLGLNFYGNNQWVHNGMRLQRSDSRYRPFREMIAEIYRRYRRPMFISETGAEDGLRTEWFNYVCDEVAAAIRAGIRDLHGICLYPILNHPGWDDDRHCYNGLLDYPDANGHREVHWPLGTAVQIQAKRFESLIGSFHMSANDADLLCFSHLRWGFVFQRPQHLMSRFAAHRRVFFWEEPVFEDVGPSVRESVCATSGVVVLTPVLPHGLSQAEIRSSLSRLLADVIDSRKIRDYVSWYYTPMALEFSAPLEPEATVYDCMDELSGFAGAPAAMKQNEEALFRQADLVFTGGVSLYQSKRKQHEDVYLFPSSVDKAHFARARTIEQERPDQAAIPRPRLGYAGVIDERMDLELLRRVAEMRPQWQFIMVGPVVKIDAGSLPRPSNMHYLGMKAYDDLPFYIAHWDIGMLPFALNDSTRYISPTKTPEYLAAGLRVVSTPIRDVVTPFGDLGFVEIAETPTEFIEKVDELLALGSTAEFRTRVDQYLSNSSWDRTWREMNELVLKVSNTRDREYSSRDLAHV